MKDAQHPVIARRTLAVSTPGGRPRKFEIQIGTPFQTSDEDFCCEINAGDVLFTGTQKVFGLDGIDALDYALQFIDTAVVHFSGGDLQWLDGTPYVRVPSSGKFEWGESA